MRVFVAFFLVLLALPALAQTRQPAQITTQPTVTPQPFDLLDKNGKWFPLAAAPGGAAGTDVRAFGCKADGTDQTACINTALTSASGCVLIPATTSGFTVNGTITVSRCLRGEAFIPNNTSADPAFYQRSSVINCQNTAAGACVVVNQAWGQAAQIENLSFVGKAGVPSDSSIGFQWKGGTNLVLNNVQFANFGTCAYFGPTNSLTHPISAHVEGMFVMMCHKHYVVQDGIPELYIHGGRWGMNGDYNTADDYVFATKTVTGGGGGGPNSLIIETVQINGGAVGCIFRWGSFIDNSGASGANKIVNSHIETVGNNYTGSATRGVFCYDATIPIIPEMKVIGNSFLEDNDPKNMPLFNINPAVTWGNSSQLHIIGNLIQNGGGLTVGNQLFMFGPIILGNWFYTPMTFTGAGTSAVAHISENTFFGGYTLTGTWNRLYVSNNQGSYTDTATGFVYAGGQFPVSWTPVLKFAGATTGITYGTQSGIINRTADGGYVAFATLVLTSKGTATGSAQITGLPIKCANSPGGTTPTSAANMTGLTGAIIAQTLGGASLAAALTQASPTGSTNVTDANFTNTSAMNVVINCGLAN